jgi:hypothetical protein
MAPPGFFSGLDRLCLPIRGAASAFFRELTSCARPKRLWTVVRLSIVLLAFFLRDSRQEELQIRAQEIVRKNQEGEIKISEARRQVQLLLKDLKKWSESEGVELQTRTRIFPNPSTGPGELLTVDRCALFHEEDLKRLCPLDVTRSEVWGGAVVFCRYVCAPAPAKE